MPMIADVEKVARIIMFHMVKHHVSETPWESACADVILLVNAQNHFHESQQLLWNGMLLIFWL